MSAPTRTTLLVDGVATETWVVHRAEVSERLFDVTRIEVTAWSTAASDLDEIIGKDARIELRLEDESVRAFHGVVLEVSESAARGDALCVDVVIVSKLSLLKLGRDHRIFQEMSVQEVVSDVLDRAGISDLCEWRVHASYEPHENIVQYGESDYDFVTRLLFEEGIGFFLEQDEAGEKVVFFDDDSSYRSIHGSSAVAWVTAHAQDRPGIRSLQVRHRVASDDVTERDYDLAAPAADLTCKAAAEDSTAREVYLHPGSYVDTARGQRLADRVLERLRAHTLEVEGETNVVWMAPGCFFSATGAPRAGVDADYLVVEVLHRLSASEGASSDWAAAGGEATVYDNHVRLIPLEVSYRPQHAPAPPVIGGVQHALVTVAGGEEIHADALGRAKVRFLWDRSGITDDKSSTWLRVGQLALGGSMILPRVDFEVLVDMELGDLDRPAISGHMYNAELPPPYSLPGGSTVSSMQTATTEGGPGANELRFEDKSGGEEIFLNASKDLTISVDHETMWKVGANQTYEVGSNNSLTVTADFDAAVTSNRSLEVGGNQDVNVGADLGDGTLGSLAVSVGGNRMVKAGGDHTEEVAGTLSRTVGSLQCLTGIAGYARTIGGSSTTNVGAAWAEIAGGARGLSVVGSYSETIGALKFIKAKNVSVSCDAAYTMNAAAELVKAGGGRTDEAKGAVALTAGGVFKVKATNIVIEAKTKLVFRGGGGCITLLAAGTAEITAPTITVENAKVLNQAMHKSN